MQALHSSYNYFTTSDHIHLAVDSLVLAPVGKALLARDESRIVRQGTEVALACLHMPALRGTHDRDRVHDQARAHVHACHDARQGTHQSHQEVDHLVVRSCLQVDCASMNNHPPMSSRRLRWMSNCLQMECLVMGRSVHTRLAHPGPVRMDCSSWGMTLGKWAAHRTMCSDSVHGTVARSAAAAHN
jgi:hypothetical protein